MPTEGEKGAAIYNPFVLRIYDLCVLGFSNSYAWGCPTKSVLKPFYRQHLGRRHLDIGVGTGYFLQDIPKDIDLTLIDLNPNALETARRRSGRESVKCIQHDVTQPLPEDQLHSEQFDSIALFYLFHCVPGGSQKVQLLRRLKPYLAEGGVVYGATVLGQGVQHNFIGRLLLALYNRKGIFSNWDDSQEMFENELRQHFDKVETKLVERVLLFSASGPKKT
ncbi:hypothetical protein VTN49DRAFT_2728 [Thermomyces lanuginosus]|uniref:uncharacterized protein n=1 Tax=Thermomyces lanuginosus TaxID=5541 RepID=UPI00374234F4